MFSSNEAQLSQKQVLNPQKGVSGTHSLNFGFGSQTTVLNFGLGSRTTVFIFGLGSPTIVLNFGFGSRTTALNFRLDSRTDRPTDRTYLLSLLTGD